MSRLRVALVQLAADQDVAANVERAVALVRQAGEMTPQLVALPEMFLYRGPASGLRESAGELPGPMTEPFAELARALDTWILLGSLAERSADPQRPYNTSVLLDPSGQICATYRKRHLFDVSIDNGPSDRESARTTPGEQSVVAVMQGVAQEADVRIGLSICFDLRFPELYREMTAAGAWCWPCPPTSPRPRGGTTGKCCCAPERSRTAPSSLPRRNAASAAACRPMAAA